MDYQKLEDDSANLELQMDQDKFTLKITIPDGITAVGLMKLNEDATVDNWSMDGEPSFSGGTGILNVNKEVETGSILAFNGTKKGAVQPSDVVDAVQFCGKGQCVLTAFL